jgi:hypothetical protein
MQTKSLPKLQSFQNRYLSLSIIIASISLATSSVALILTANYAQAAVLFDSGSPNLQDGADISRSVSAEDFNLSQSANVTSIDFWAVEFGIWDGSLQYNLFTNAVNQPSNTAFASGTGVNIVKTSTGRNSQGFPEYKYSFDLSTPATLAANTTYWLGLHVNNNFNSGGLFWETTSSGFGLNSLNSFQGTFDNWSSNSNQLAFALNGSPTTSVPEPFTIIGTLVGGTAAFRMRKKLKAIAK